MEYLNWCADHPILTIFMLWAFAGIIAAPFKREVDVNVNYPEKDDK